MKRLQSYKYRLNLPDGAATRLSQYAGCARLVWNLALVAGGLNYTNFRKTCAMLPIWKEKFAFLRDADAVSLQQSLRDLERAWKNFHDFPDDFNRPVYKKRQSHSSFRIVGKPARKTLQGKVWLPKFGWLAYRNSRPWCGKVTNVTFSRRANRWYVSILCEREVADPAKRQDNCVGIDVGIARYATLSTGEWAPSIFAYRRARRKLAKLARKLARAKKGSKRRIKTKMRLAACHAQIANKRAAHAHQVSSLIVKKHGRVKMEDLRLSNMMKSAKGTVENPGKNVAQKAGLNRHLADQGLRQFRTFLKYKLAWSGGILETVPAHYTSQTCHACKHVARENRVTQADFACVACGHTDHADVNAAKNIRDTAVGTIAVKALLRRRQKAAVDVRTLSVG